MLICLNLQSSFLTSPFGWALFVLKGAALPQVRTVDTYNGVILFIAMELIAISVVFSAPSIALWLPDYIGW
jgi:TRAP-type mannitol/chloroaromatic compound transport system permease large subunit